MAVSKNASITFSINGQNKTCHIAYAGSLADILAFARALQPYSRATITTVSYTEAETEPQLTPAAGAGTIAEWAEIHLIKPSGSGLQKISLITPDDDVLLAIDGVGYRVKQTPGQQIAKAYSTLRGQTYMFQTGIKKGN